MYFEKNQQTIKSVNIFSVGKGFNNVWLILQEKLISFLPKNHADGDK